MINKHLYHHYYRLWWPRYWFTWVLVMVLRSLARLPFTWLWALGHKLGHLAYYVVPGRVNIAQANLRQCFPTLSATAINRLTYEHFGYLGQAVCCQGLSWVSSRTQLQGIIHFRHRHYLDHCLQARRPVIVLVPHFVGLELGGSGFTALIDPGIYVYQRIRNPVLEHQIYHGRTRFGGIAVEHRQSLRPIIQAIRRGVPLFYLPDQDPGRRRGIFVPFCGTLAATVPILSRLVQLTEAVVIPAFATFLPAGAGLELRFGEPLPDLRTATPEEGALWMNRCIEQAIQQSPAQYFWVHRRFKTRPVGEAAFYNR
jgi:KDO2-lipid IV(A) lauroyltransferase